MCSKLLPSLIMLIVIIPHIHSRIQQFAKRATWDLKLFTRLKKSVTSGERTTTNFYPCYWNFTYNRFSKVRWGGGCLKCRTFPRLSLFPKHILFNMIFTYE